MVSAIGTNFNHGEVIPILFPTMCKKNGAIYYNVNKVPIID
jgi:hypothetical protein